MTKTLIDKNVYKDMDNKTLLTRKRELEIKISKLMNSRTPADLMEDLSTIQKFIDEEIDDRLDDGRMDEDELEEDF